MKKTLKSILMLCALFTATSIWADNSWFVNNEDYSNMVGNWTDVGSNLGESWHNFGGTLERSGVALTEWWRGTGPSSGKVMSQTFTGLPAGKYTVEIYANAMASGSENTNGAKVAEAYANTATKALPLMHKNMSVPALHTIDAEVGSDGTLEVGINSTASGANWFAAKIKSITYRGTNAIAHNDEGTWWNRQNNNDNPGSYGKGGIVLRESYLTNATTEGDMVTKTLTGLANGYYHVSLFAAASYTSGRGFDSPATDGEMNRSFVYAGTQDASIPVVYRTDVLQAPDRYTFYNVNVTDGTLKVGVRNDQGGANWHLLAVDYVHYMGEKPDYSYLLPENVTGNWDGGEAYTNFGYKEVGKYMGNSHTQSVGTPISGKVTGLQVGLYELTVHCTANWADWSESAPVAEGTEDCTVITANGISQSVPIHQGKQPAEQQTYTLSNIPVDESGEMNIAVVNEKEGANWITFSAQRLVWTGTDTRLQANALRGLITTAQRRADEIMPTTISDDLTSATNAALALVGTDQSFVVTATEEELGEATTTLQAAIAAIDTWTADWAAAKAPLIAAMERFEADYNDGANGALRKMSTGAWNTLVAAAGAAATAKDQYEDLTALGTAATTFNAAMDAAEPSIALYSKYELLMNALNRYDATTFPKATYDTEANHATDATVTAAIAAINTAWETCRATLEGSQNVTALAGQNLDFETAQGEQRLSGDNRGIYEQPGWTITYVNNVNSSLETMTGEGNVPTTSAGTHSLRIYSNWTTSGDVMQVKQSTVLPAGNYRVEAALKMAEKNWNESLNYIEVGGTRHALNAGSNWETVGLDLEIVEPTLITISFGHVARGGNNKMDVYADDITLTLFNQTAYERAYAAVDALKGNGSVAIASVINEYPATQAEAEAASINIETAIAVMNNAVTMAAASDKATGLLTNADFTGGTSSLSVQGSGGAINYPSGWTFTKDFSGWNDCNVNEGVFNMWAGTIKESELSQVISNLPNGVYEISGEFKNDKIGGQSGIGIFADQLGTATGRSIDVGVSSGNSDDFYTYSAIVEVKANKMRVGVNSRGGYYQLKNFQVKMLAAAENDATKAGIANCRLYQSLAFNRDALEYDFTGDNYANAQDADVKPMLTQPNAIFKAKEGQLNFTTNVIIDGTCANLVLTDKAQFRTTTGFTATAATYTRTMSSTWGTVVLPYAVSSDDNVQFYTLSKVVTGEDGYMSFTEAATLAPNTPGVFVKKNESAESVTLTGSNVAIAATPETLAASDLGDWTLNGTYYTCTFDATYRSDALYYIAADKFWHATSLLEVQPFRAYFTTAQASSSAARAFRLVIDADEDAIRLVPVTDGEQEIYTLGGVKVQQPLRPGIYIINNKKTIVK